MNEEINDDLATFRIYGDNILECENVITWITDKNSGFEIIDENGSIERPIYTFRYISKNIKFYVQICPYYGGTGKSIVWRNDPLGEVFKEKPDAIISRVDENGKDKKPLVAIEFCDALQAGNQAWQRFKRALDPIEVGIPYLYVLPLIGWERDSEGEKLKNPRYQSSQITLAQLSVSGLLGIPSLQIYKDTPWARYAVEKNKSLPKDFDKMLSEKYAIEYISGLLKNSLEANSVDLAPSLKEITKSMLRVSRFYSSFSNTELPIHSSHPSLLEINEDSVSEAYGEAFSNLDPIHKDFALHNISFEDFVKAGIPFYKDLQKKTSSEEFFSIFSKYFNFKPDHVEKFQNKVKLWTTDDLIDDLEYISQIPLTYKNNKSEAFVVKNVEKLTEILLMMYPDLNSEVVSWLRNLNRELIVIPMYGYKPSGDSRPDRGLVPMIYALFPKIAKEKNILVLMYSKHTPKNWEKIIKNRNNELWNTISQYSGAIIVNKTKTGMILK